MKRESLHEIPADSGSFLMERREAATTRGVIVVQVKGNESESEGRLLSCSKRWSGINGLKNELPCCSSRRRLPRHTLQPSVHEESFCCQSLSLSSLCHVGCSVSLLELLCLVARKLVPDSRVFMKRVCTSSRRFGCCTLR